MTEKRFCSYLNNNFDCTAPTYQYDYCIGFLKRLRGGFWLDIKDEADLVNVRLGIILKYVLKKMEKQSVDSCEIDFEHIPITIEIKKKKMSIMEK